MKGSSLSVTDQFCGAGGSSQGVRRIASRIPGVEVKLAMNHWKLAIETHSTNFPETLHENTDISACDPRRYPSTNILITSPECTNHSLAKGQKRVKAQLDLFNSGKLDPAHERSRATMWDVPRFTEYHKYEVIIVENVVDAREWVMYDAWLHAMHSLGYMHKAVYLNSMFCHPTPQSRDRMYVVFWKKGNPAPDLEFRPKAHCPKCLKDIEAAQRWKNGDKKFGKFRKQYTYVCPSCATEVMPYFHAAFNCIDWSDIGTRIGDRKKPLSENTVRRIEYGLKKFGNDSFLMHAAYGKTARATERLLSDPLFTQTSLASQAICHPFIINDQHSTGLECRVKSSMDRLPTIPGEHHLYGVFPFVVKEEHAMELRHVGDSMATQTTRQSMGLVTPFVAELKKTSKARDISNPLSTLTSVGYHGLVTPESYSSFLTYFYGKDQASGINEATGTVSTKDRIALVSHTEPKIEDCYFRMLRPDEIKLAMAFDPDYVILGNQKDQVKQCGNAVTPPAMEWLVGQSIATLQ